ncbi:MAG: ribonuclease J [Alphaproteobacteria bacterium]|nr:ribonuclease J [Alphaproteobacteria bacterium]
MNKENELSDNSMQEEQPEVLIPNDSLVFVPLGGITGIGMNFFLYGYQGKWLVVDCGMGFSDDHFPGVDLLLPDPTFIARHKKDIVGLVITHGHEDHIGAIPYLWRDLQCPIYATPFTAELIEDKLMEFDLMRRAEINVVEKDSTIDLNPFEIEFISTDHSIPEPNMLAIHTPEGIIVHSGDWRFGQNDIDIDTKPLQKLGKKGVLALISDSTNIFVPAQEKSELDVANTLKELFAKQKGRIFITCFASNVTRMESIYKAAKENGRFVCLLGRSLWRIDDAARSTGYLKDVLPFLTEEQAEELDSNKIVYVCTGSQGEPYSSLSKLASVNNASSIRLNETDVVIFSSRVIPGNEQAIASLQRRLMATGCKIITDKDALVHVSGHPARADVQKLYQILKPKIVIPVHGEPLQLIEQKKLALESGIKIAINLEEGDVLELNDAEPEILGEVPVGCLAVDGKKIIPISASVIKKRRQMIDAGSVVVTVVVNRNGEILGQPQLSSFGLLTEEDGSQDELFKSIFDTVQNLDENKKKDDVVLKEEIRIAVRHFINEMYGKKPLLEIHLIRI